MDRWIAATSTRRTAQQRSSTLRQGVQQVVCEHCEGRWVPSEEESSRWRTVLWGWCLSTVFRLESVQLHCAVALLSSVYPPPHLHPPPSTCTSTCTRHSPHTRTHAADPPLTTTQHNCITRRRPLPPSTDDLLCPSLDASTQPSRTTTTSSSGRRIVCRANALTFRSVESLSSLSSMPAFTF